MKRLLLSAGLIVIGLASAAHASVVLTDIQSFSDAGGIWNDDNTANWAIWMAAGTDPTAPPTFLNSTGTNSLPNAPVTIPDGTSSYILFKAQYGTSDQSDNLIFGSSTLTISPNLAYIASSSTPATGTAGPITIGGEQVSLSGFGWYAPGAYQVDYVSQGQNATPDGTGDNLVALLTLTVTPAPEPGSLALLGLGGLGLLCRRRNLT